MDTKKIHADQVEFVLLSFEGPDRYALAGGLGVRATHLAESLAQCGFRTHLFFVGDPSLPAVEAWQTSTVQFQSSRNGHNPDARPVQLYRWCQWISKFHPNGVYEGEEAKLNDWNASLPPFLVEQVARPAIEHGRTLVVLAEEWHTAQSLIALSDQLNAAGLRQNAVLLWNANNTMGFERVDWPRLNFVSTITTVSRYMKQIMRAYGLDPLVIPNGIPANLLQPVPSEAVERVRDALTAQGQRLLLKVGRFDPAKCWWMAVEAAAQLKQAGERICFLCRGGIEPHGVDVLNHARELDLQVRDVDGNPSTWQEALALIQQTGPADLYNLRFYLSQEMLRILYAAADVVLANSKHEPFGLVGLEAMAAGGVVFTGPTGESYSTGREGAIAIDTESADEIFIHLHELFENPELAYSLRRSAPNIAARYTWDLVLDLILEKVVLAARHQKVNLFERRRRGNRRVQDVVVYTVVHQPRRLRLPARPIPASASPNEIAECLFDEDMNHRYFQKVAQRCYYPATRKFLELVERENFKLTIGFSMSFIEQARRWDRELLELFTCLVQHPHVELAAVEPYHNFLLLWDVPGFVERMQYVRHALTEVFGKTPQVADTTELMMSDTIYHALDQIGYRGAFLDGRPWVMNWRESSYLYRHSCGNMNLLTRHYQLSDDVGYRFSNHGWSGWPLMADTYANWLAQTSGDLVVLGWDYETFGEHHSLESGIFDFIDTFARETPARGLRFSTASEAIVRYQDEAYELPLPVFHSTWAGSGGLDFFLGNPVQQSIFQLMMSAYNKARLTGDPALIDLAQWLAMSDNLHLIQWYGRQGSEAEVSAYFTPREWWQLGPERIIREMQQVYQNFIHALDNALPATINRPASRVYQPRDMQSPVILPQTLKNAGLKIDSRPLKSQSKNQAAGYSD